VFYYCYYLLARLSQSLDWSASSQVSLPSKKVWWNLSPHRSTVIRLMEFTIWYQMCLKYTFHKQSSVSWNKRPCVSMKFLDQLELYFIYSLPMQAFLMLEEGIVKCLRDSYWTAETLKSGFKTIFAFPSIHLSILTAINLLVTSTSFSCSVSQCTFNTVTCLMKFHHRNPNPRMPLCSAQRGGKAWTTKASSECCL